jgi:cytochrome b subunit of formate dehydrogenase
MIKRAVHWLVAIAVVLHLFSCIFLGESYMPSTMDMLR